MNSITLDATIDNLSKVLQFIDEKIEEHDVPMKTGIALDVAVEEMYVNIAHYAYGDVIGKATISIDFPEDENCVRIVFEDNGIPFDPLAKPDPDISLTAEERKIGGLGIYMVKQSMDFVSYSREKDTNIFTMKKFY